jgi:predicted transposase YdaD
VTETSHDQLFNFAFSEIENARALLGSLLPEDVSVHIDWGTLRAEPTSTIDERLKQRHCDLLFSVLCNGRRAFVYVLLEHQSEPDRMMPYRMLVHLVRICEWFSRTIRVRSDCLR